MFGLSLIVACGQLVRPYWVQQPDDTPPPPLGLVYESGGYMMTPGSTPGLSVTVETQTAPRDARTTGSAPRQPAQLVAPALASASSCKGSGALHVTRIAPTGEVPDLYRLTISFDRPMVALSGASGSSLPVSLTPAIPGSWHWLSTSTLAFSPRAALPSATELTIQVPRGVCALDGSALAEPFSATLRTPLPTLTQSWPDPRRPTIDRLPTVVLRFDHAVDGARLIASARFVMAGGTVAAEAVDPASVPDTADSAYALGELARMEQRDHAVVFRPRSPLPEDSPVELTTGPVPSPEGQRMAPPVHLKWRTEGALRIVESSCWEGCPVGAPWTISLSNPLPEPFDARTLVIDPPVAIERVELDHRQLSVVARARPHQRYRVTLPVSLADTSGHALAGERSATFETGALAPWLEAPQQFTVLDPRKPPGTLSFKSRGLTRVRVRAVHVEPGQTGEYERIPGLLNENKPLPFAFGKGKEVRIHDPLVTTRTELSLASLVGKRVDDVVVIVDAPGAATHGDGVSPRVAWLSATRLSVDLVRESDHLTVWATELASGAPVQGAVVTMSDTDSRVLTDADGLARVPFPNERASAPRTLSVRRGDDVVTNREPDEEHGPAYAWARAPITETLRISAFSVRPAVRPGDHLQFKGYVRALSPDGRAPLLRVPQLRKIQYELARWQQSLAHGEITLDEHGEFALDLPLPATTELGLVQLVLHANESTASVAVLVEALRRGNFEVDVRPSQAEATVGERVGFTTAARYFTGGPVAGAEASFSLISQAAAFHPPGFAAFTFGGTAGGSSWGFAETHETHTLTTGGDGRATLALRIDRAAPATAYTLHAQTRVRDHDNAPWTEVGSMLIHPASAYVGLQQVRAAQTDTPVSFAMIAVEPGGKQRAGLPLSLRAERITYGRAAEQKLVCAATSSDQPTPCTLRFALPGSYRLIAELVDEQGRRSETHGQISVVPREPEVLSSLVTYDRQIGADKEHYAPGETAQITLTPPASPAYAWVRIDRARGTENRVVKMLGPTTMAVPIGEDDLPALPIMVRYATDVAALEKLHSGDISQAVLLPVDVTARALSVQVAPGESRPGADVAIDVHVRDAQGRPAPAAQVALAVVDEAVLRLGDDSLPDPLAELLVPRATDDGGWSTRMALFQDLMTVHPESASLRDNLAGPEGSLRTRFEPVAYFVGALPVDAQGVAHAHFRAPDDLTRYRVLAVASSAGDGFGAGTSTLLVRTPLMLRVTPPRFLTVGDSAEVVASVENARDTAVRLRVAASLTGPGTLASGTDSLSVPAHASRTFPLRVHASAVGALVLSVKVQGDVDTDGVRLTVPVSPAASTEHYASYDVLDVGADGGETRQSLALPKDASAQNTTLSLSSSAVSGAFDDAVQDDFPHSALSLAARIMTRCAHALRTGERDLGLQQAVDELDALVHEDGSVAAWPEGPVEPFVALLAADALACAAPAHAALARIRASLADLTPRLESVDADARPFLEAYALAVLGTGDHTVAVRRLAGAQPSRLPTDTLSMLVLALEGGDANLRKSLAGVLAARIEENAASAAPREPDARAAVRESPVRSSALSLLALTKVDSPAPREKLVHTLVHGQSDATSAVDAAFRARALAGYTRAFEREPSALSVHAWADQTALFAGAPTEQTSGELSVPASARVLRVTAAGAGRLYQRLRSDFTRSGPVAALDQGFLVERSYEPLDDPRDVTRGKDGRWRVRAGARVRIHVSFLARSASHHVALHSAFPAGFAPLQTPPSEQGVNGSVSDEPATGETHADYHAAYDDRLVALFEHLPAGPHSFSVRAVATHAGVYAVAPAHVEQQHTPESFGRSTSEQLEVR